MRRFPACENVAPHFWRSESGIVPRVLTAIGQVPAREVERVTIMPWGLFGGRVPGKAMDPFWKSFYACSSAGNIARGVVRGENDLLESAAFGLGISPAARQSYCTWCRWRYVQATCIGGPGYFRRSDDRPTGKKWGTSISRGESGGRAVSSARDKTHFRVKVSDLPPFLSPESRTK